jgi:formiminoglutamase
MTIRQTDRWYDWLVVERGEAPLVLSVPHAGTELPGDIGSQLVSSWLARKDTDLYVDRLYSFAAGLGATVIRTLVSRTMIDVNRDPEGRSLYPGQATTELCPTTTFDGEPLYRAGAEPDAPAIATRRMQYFAPYHSAIAGEITRLRRKHGKVVLYDAHSIRSAVPRLFEGTLPVFNLGTNSGQSCAPELERALEEICGASGMPTVVNGRFKGGYITRHYGQPDGGVHAVQLELAMRGYLDEPAGDLREDNWPPAYDATRAAALIATLQRLVAQCLSYVQPARRRRTRART